MPAATSTPRVSDAVTCRYASTLLCVRRLLTLIHNYSLLDPQIIGAGVGGMPYALKEAGFYGGMVLLIVVAMCSDYTVRKIVLLGQKVKRKYYEDLCASQFGHAGYVFVVGAMGIFSYGAAVAYLIGIGEMPLEELREHGAVYDDRP